MTTQEKTGYGLVALFLLLLYWLLKNPQLHQTAVVQSSIALPGGQTNEPTITQFPQTACCG